MPELSWQLSQVWLLGAGLAAGGVLTLLAGCYRLALGRRRPQKRDYYLPDALFSLAATLLLACFWFRFTDGSLPLSSLAALWVGYWLCQRLLGRLAAGRPSSRRKRSRSRSRNRPASTRASRRQSRVKLPLPQRAATAVAYSLIRRAAGLRAKMAAIGPRRQPPPPPVA